MTARPSIPAIAPGPLAARIDRQCAPAIVPQPASYVRSPAKGPHFDPYWTKR